MKKIKLLIVDDHKVVRAGIRLLFQTDNEVNIVGEAEDGEMAIELVKKLHPDVVITDISMPNMSGIQLTKKLKEEHPNVKVLIISMHNDDDYIIDALEAGAMGYITKDSNDDEIINAVHSISNDKMYYDSSISDVFAKKLLKQTKSASEIEKLTERELEVLEFIVLGMSNKEIANKLFVSKRTIDNHRTNCMRKISAKNTADIVRIAYQNNLVRF